MIHFLNNYIMHTIMIEKLPTELQWKAYMYSIESIFLLYPKLYEELINEVNKRKSFAYRIDQAKKQYYFNYIRNVHRRN